MLESALNVKIYRELPFGFDEIADLKKKFPAWDPKTIFDVGANVGQMAVFFSKHFPSASIYSFEPSASTFKTLQERTRNLSNVRIFETAIGNLDADAYMVQESSSDKNRIMQKSETYGDFETGTLETVKMTTLTTFCSLSAINHIHFLKVDTEGFDLEVVKSGREMLSAHKIDFVELELGMHSRNQLHVPFEDAKKFMQEYGYEVFGIYEQVHEWKAKEPILRRVNALFVSPAMY